MMTEEQLFQEAISLTGMEREEFLLSACRSDEALRQRVEQLIKAHESPDSLLENSHSENDLASTTGQSSPAKHPIIGNYKLLHKLGEGGFGVVYMAEQQRPVRRKVALKIVKTDRLSEASSTIARFEAERQALAMMEHPNIATVFDGGTIPAGSTLLDEALGNIERPFFAMELVNGVPITEYCDKNNLPTSDRLDLFMTVCHAVQHAHQKGVIHRDLKPSNILVTLHDGRPVVKIIDFGVAKAINQQLTDKTLFTVLGDMIGTPLYMSPEQAERSGLDIDTRSDVYSLGVLLFELLTGSTPITAAELQKAGVLQIQRKIVDSEPPKPSTRLSSSGDKLTVIAKHRNISPEKLHRELAGDLDWIVMKALEKDRTRRYDSASRFADDIRRYLSDDLVEARPPSAWYRTTRFCRRHRGLVAGTLAGFCAMSFVLAMTLYQNGQVRKANEQISRRESKLRETVVKLREQLIEIGLLYALNGEPDNMQQIIEDLELIDEESKEKSVWPDLLRGQLTLYGKNAGEARVILKRATRQDPENIAARAMYVSALAFDGMVADALPELAELRELDPTGKFEKLFVGQAFAMGMTPEDDAYAESLLKDSISDGTSPLAFAIHAQILGHRALDLGKLSTAKRAQRRIIAAHEHLPNNPFVSMIYVSVHHTLFNLGVAGVDQTKLLEVIDEVGDFREYAIGHLVVGFCYADLEMWDDAKRVLLKASSNGDWWGNYALILLREGRTEEVRTLVQQMLDRNKTNRDGEAVKNMHVLFADAIDGTFDPAPVVRRASSPEIGDIEFSVLIYALLVGGQREQVTMLTNTRRLEESVAGWVMPGFLTTDREMAEVLNEFEDSKLGLCNALHTVGLMHLASGDGVEARKWFQACLDTKEFFANGYFESQMLIKLIDDGRLPVNEDKRSFAGDLGSGEKS